MPVRSMTGYGQGSAGQEIVCKLEIKAVNHRYCDVVVRGAREYSVLEDRIRRVVSEYVHRGRLEVYLKIEDFAERRRTVKINQDLVQGYADAFAEMERILGTAVDRSVLPTLPDVLEVTEETADADKVWGIVEDALRQALEGLVSMRREEGQKLAADISRRLSTFAGLIDDIADRAPAVVEEYRERLHNRIAELCSDIDLDPGRLEAEVAIFADRSAIDEEIVRARSHIAQMKDFLAQDGPVGRKLDFLLQEMNREINTIGSKSPDADISRLVVEGKSELEKIREQVQNIE